MSEPMTDAPPGSSGSHRDRAGGASSDAGAWLRAWLLAGLATAALELLTSLATELPFSVGGAVLVTALVSLTALGMAGLTKGVERVVAPGSLAANASALRTVLARGTPLSDPALGRRASVSILTLPVTLLGLVGLSAACAYFVVTRSEAPQFIALLLGVLAPLVLGCAALLTVAFRRVLLQVPRLPPPRAALAGLLVVAAVLAVAVVATQHETLAHLGAHALMPPLVLVSLSLTLFVALPRGLAHPGRVALAVALLASVAILGGWRLPRARSFTTRATWSTGYLVAGLQSVSDLDRDGVASFPFGADCAPFDGTRSPLARELPENGVDENCDGRDTPAAAQDESGPLTIAPLTGDQPDLYLITVDALRADHLGFMGYDAHPTSPDLDALVGRGVVFERAYSQDSGTAPSMWSLMVGKTPFQAELVATGFPPNYADSETTLAEHLKAAGYTTHARLCGSMFAAPTWNLRRGFDEFDEVCQRRPRELGPFVLDSARPLLSTPADDAPASEHVRPPRFVWLHFFDPHHPYVDHPALEFGDQSMDLYDEEIRYVQEFVAEAIRLALDDGHARPRFVVLSADHGENFSEHGRDPHARTLYREVTHVPLVFFGAELEARRVAAPVALGDVFPTFLNLAGVPTPSRTTMESLVPTLLGGRPDPARAIFQENSWSRPTHHVKAMILGRYHLIRDLTDDTTELYDMVADPRERVNRIDGGIAEQSDLLRRMEAFIATTNIPEAYR
ncbi:MAG: sulfatase-like hydrolase/transferase [Sandaracinaceae bacterium]|jgi:arylsulfatase A-like enzyme|nr:sulfatase-like hydrolase/transferase [Sandaracinaceae bacterium]MBK7776463.1 sulfatase-like hydrolase/transferase [Sandaracinaceae bacterium]MBK8590869.1 sulfatase-like hydrolase/transferase [Sandaracinaceae bacterium]MBP7682403.1 sulfatase-like hydrolase/transferase [Deltaproteobacteria bacterium]